MYYDDQGRQHISMQEADNAPQGAYIIDDPYPDPKYYPGDTPVADDTLDGLAKRVAQLEKQVPRQTEGLRRVTEGKYQGAAGSAGIVVELEGGQTTVNAQPDFH